MILRAVKLFCVRRQLVQQGLSNGEHVADIVVVAQQFQVKVGLEVWLGKRAIWHELVLIAIEQIDVIMRVDCLGVRKASWAR